MKVCVRAIEFDGFKCKRDNLVEHLQCKGKEYCSFQGRDATEDVLFNLLSHNIKDMF
jgi:hypothetical protein